MHASLKSCGNDNNRQVYQRSPVREVEMTDDEEEEYEIEDDDDSENVDYNDGNQYSTPVHATRRPISRALRRGVPRSYSQSSRRSKRLPCSCLDCCPCITDITSVAGLWIFYCLHLYLALRVFSDCMNDRRGNIIVVVFHLLLSHVYVKAIQLERPPSMLIHCFSIVMICLRVLYWPN